MFKQINLDIRKSFENPNFYQASGIHSLDHHSIKIQQKQKILSSFKKVQSFDFIITNLVYFRSNFEFSNIKSKIIEIVSR
jgi:hypothetical protein